MISKLVLASNNQGKLREFNELFKAIDITVIPQSRFNVPPVEETGLTFVENAIIKARHASTHTNLPAIADDSGIEVDYLKGAPGIYSARYAGKNSNDEDNCNALLAALKTATDNERTARYQCILAFMRHKDDPTPLISQASWEGHILTDPISKGGFGYDPIFWVPTEKCSASQLPPKQKNTLSHRGKALKKLIQEIQA